MTSNLGFIDDSHPNMVGKEFVNVSQPEATNTQCPKEKFTLNSLLFWRGPQTEGSKTRIIVPNHAVPPSTKREDHPNSKFCGNMIRTTKYTLLSFFPKNLWEQLHRFANVFFISIVLLNWIMDIFGKEIAAFPVIFVLGVTAVKDVFEDRRRYKSDRRINNATCRVWSRQEEQYVDVKWKKVKVGDIVKVYCEDAIPADILLLRTSDENGLCYIETMNLDGENNLKQREVVRGFEDMQATFDVATFDCSIEVENPTTKVYHFSGNLTHKGDHTPVPLKKENLVLRDCFLKNTDFVEGIVIYAGHDSKAMLNNGGPRHKRTRLERLMNTEVLCCVVILIVMCVIGAIGSTRWNLAYNDKAMFLPPPDPEEEEDADERAGHLIWEGFVSLISYIVLLQMMVPLSLYVTIELTKLAQIYHIHNDKDLYDPDTNKKVECRAMNITEDLGQIQYIFSDKTGTLTENKMMFRRCCVAGRDYNHEMPSAKEEKQYRRSNYAPPLKPNANLIDHLSESIQGHDSEERRAHDFFLVLAACNTVVIAHKQKKESSDKDLPSSSTLDPTRQSRRRGSGSTLVNSVDHMPNYEAESPDELALVQAAYSYNFGLVKRTPKSMKVAMPDGDTAQYVILQVLPFDSIRKRMSVILRHSVTKEIVLLSKGADNAMFARLKVNRANAELVMQTKLCIDNYAREGLRVLVMAKRCLPEDEYDDWLLGYEQAERDMDNREALMYDAWCKLETSMELVGATGVEDRLQERVPETIESLRLAGIVVWVLTGDKQETAENISYSCRLFTQSMELIRLNKPTKEAVDECIMYHLGQIKSKRHGDYALVVDGGTLTFILDMETKLMSKFLELTKLCSSVLCCRATPLQKACIVSSVKKQLGMITLAIGDGANDVSMIQRADIGIGISGKEGMQAVMASDFAISKFKYLEKLLLVHGHWCYDRLARMILYFLYKNAAWVFVIFWYQLLNGWSGSVMIDQVYMMVFNLLFTALPPMAIGIYDQDASAELLLSRPELYKQGRLRKVHQLYTFWLNMLDALYQSIVIFFVAYGAYNGSDVGMFEFGTTITISCMYVMLIHMAVESKSWTLIHVLSIVVSVMAFYAFAFTYNTFCIKCLGFENPFMVIHEIIGAPVHWLTIVISALLAVTPRMAIKCLLTIFYPSDVTLALIQEREEASLADDDGSGSGSWFWSSSSSLIKDKTSWFCCRKANRDEIPQESGIDVVDCSSVPSPQRVHSNVQGTARSRNGDYVTQF